MLVIKAINKSEDEEGVSVGRVNMLGGKEQVITHLVNLIAGEWSIRRHEEMTTRSWDEGGNNSDQVIVHIAGVP